MNNDDTLIRELRNKEYVIRDLIQQKSKLLDQQKELRDVLMVFFENMKYLDLNHRTIIHERLAELQLKH